MAWLIPVAAVLIFLPITGNAQTALTEAQAEEAAEALLGRKPDHVDTYFSEGRFQYFAFTYVQESKWDEATNTATLAQEEIRFYEGPRGANEMREFCQEIVLFWPEAQRSLAKNVSNNGRPKGRPQLWPGYLRQFIRYDLPSGFVTLPGRTSPCLRLSADFGPPQTLPGATKRLGLFCLEERRLSWLDYEPEFGSLAQTGVVGRVKVNDEHAPDGSARSYLLSWGQELGLNVPSFDATSRAPRIVQQRWLDANGRKACCYRQTPTFDWKGWNSDQIDKLTPYTTRSLLKDPRVVLDDGRYQWLSYPGPEAHAAEGSALAGVGRYDTKLQRYDLIYVPDSSYDYSKELVLIGDWLYIQDCDEHWAVRFNTVTHRLQRGDFGAIVGDLKTGIYPQGRPSHTGTAEAGIFWTDHRDQTFRHGRFSPAIEQFILTMMQTLPMEAKGVNCDFGQHNGGCSSDNGSAIDLYTNKDKGTQELEVIGASVPPQNEGPFEDLAQIALLYVNRPAWKGHVVPGVAQLKVKFSSVGTGVSMLTHYGEGYEVDLAVMDKGTFVMIGATMGLMGDLGETWEHTWVEKSKQLPDCKYWSLSIIPQGR
jgi:hypothetical protein